jgi:hypothetical protein
MKKLLAPAALLLLLAASACTTTPDNTNTGAGNANSNVNTSAAATPTPAGPTQADIETRERQTWEQLKSKSWDAFAATLDENFVFVGGPGVFGKAETMDTLKKVELLEYTLSDFRFVKVDADLAVITYTAVDKSTDQGKSTGGKPIRNSTAWVNRNGKWLVGYHQESEVLEMPEPTPTPATAASPAASPAIAASPAASPAAIASAIDAEKAVWEAIKAKNADAFASFLLPEALEVEPEGVFDKATQVKMIGMFDASKFMLSDFKETKFDADATLLTYKVSGPDRGRTIEMYHSTVWINRGGQWRAVFHHGTYAQNAGPR